MKGNSGVENRSKLTPGHQHVAAQATFDILISIRIIAKVKIYFAYVGHLHYLCAVKSSSDTIIMARPIRETPILTGEDAIRFMQEMQTVENLSNDVRSANRAALHDSYQQAISHIQICI